MWILSGRAICLSSGFEELGRYMCSAFYTTALTTARAPKLICAKRAREAVHCLRWALRRGRKPEALYLDNGRQFRAKEFKAECKKLGIRLIFGRPRNPRGRGKLESYHKALYRELISQKEFTSLSHFRREMWKFDKKYNEWRKLSCLGWITPVSIYNDEKYFKKCSYKVKKRTYVLATN